MTIVFSALAQRPFAWKELYLYLLHQSRGKDGRKEQIHRHGRVQRNIVNDVSGQNRTMWENLITNRKIIASKTSSLSYHRPCRSNPFSAVLLHRTRLAVRGPKKFHPPRTSYHIKFPLSDSEPAPVGSPGLGLRLTGRRG
eukprot:28412-Hanusia_phi.AAC.20